MNNQILHICNEDPYNKVKKLKKNLSLWSHLLESIRKKYSDSVLKESDIGKIYLYYNLSNPEINLFCNYGNKKNYSSWKNGYLCGKSCLCVKEKRKLTNVTNFGVKNCFQSNIIKEKIKQTNIEKYGVEHNSYNPETVAKRKQTMIVRYGVEHNTHLKSDQEKRIRTNIQKYGSNNPLSSPEIKEKIKQTNIKKYDVENPLASPIIQEKIKQTNLTKYGVEHNSYNPETIEKRRNTFNQHFDNNFISIVKKRKDTAKKKYDRDYSNQRHISKKTLNILNDLNTLANLLKTNSISGLANKLGISETTIINYHKRHKLNIIRPTNNSSYEFEIKDWLTKNNVDYKHRERKQIYPKELDFYIPKYNVAIEFQGDYWHMNPKIYNENDYNQIAQLTAKQIWQKDSNKKILCENKGIKLFQIWELDWNKNKEKIKHSILKEIK
jgi:G:T-mismatch repair DNA endonuclease (very short patch repair protein)